MGFLAGKKILIAGLLSNRSIAYGIAAAMKRQGAELAFTYQMEKHAQRVADLAADFDSKIILPCDVAEDAQIDALFPALGQHWDGLDGVVHSLAFVPKVALDGDYLDAINREHFRIAHDISSYSFSALAKAAYPMMEGRRGSLLTLSYLGAERTMPNYNVMGVAKAALEASVRYMAEDLGKQAIRVNAISAGPLKTLAASGIGDFRFILKWNELNAPLRRNVTLEEVGNSGLYFLSDLGRAVTGEIHHVDCGYHMIGLAAVDKVHESAQLLTTLSPHE